MAKTRKICTFLLRLVALCANLSATILMATNHETAIVFSIKFEAKVSQIPAFKFFVIMNAIACVYGLLVLFLPSKSVLWRLIVALDAIVTILLATSVSASLTIAYVGKKGYSHSGWLPICDRVPKFCDRVAVAIIAGLVGLILHTVILLHAIHTAVNPLLI